MSKSGINRRRHLNQGTFPGFETPFDAERNRVFAKGFFSVPNDLPEACLSLDNMTLYYVEKMHTLTTFQAATLDALVRTVAHEPIGSFFTLAKVSNANISSQNYRDLARHTKILLTLGVLDLREGTTGRNTEFRIRHSAFEEWYRIRNFSRRPNQDIRDALLQRRTPEYFGP